MPEETNPTETRKPETSSDLKAVLEALSAKHGDHETVAMKLIKQNVELGTKLATAEGKVKELESSLSTALPKDHVAILKADADLLASYKPLGEPATIKASLDKVPALETTLARRDHEAGLGKVATTMGYELSVLKTLAPQGITFNPIKVKVKGQAEEIDSFEVIDTDDSGKERRRPLSEVEASDWKTFLPALKPDGNSAQGQGQSNRHVLPIGGSPFRGTGRISVGPTGEPFAREVTPREETAHVARRIASVL